MNILKNNQTIKFLFIRLSSIGDILLTTPLLRAVKSTYPNAIIDYVVAKNFADILAGNQNIDNLILYDKQLSFRQIMDFKQKTFAKNVKYDYVIDLQNNLRSKIFRHGLGRTTRKIPKNRLFKLGLVYFKHQFHKPIHAVDNYFSTLDGLNIFPDSKGLEISCDKNFSLNQLIPDFSDYYKIIAVAPGAAHATKQYPMEKIIEVINSLNTENKYLYLLLGGKTDISVCQSIATSTSAKTLVLAGTLSLRESAQAISQADLMLTNDTGLMHIASACQVPIIAIFGSTVPALGFSPYHCTHQIIEKDQPCRPCTHIGRSTCPKEHFLCMKSIKSEQIVAAARNYLSNDKC